MLDYGEGGQPLLTILTPTYNRRHLLPRLYDSIIRQRVPDGTFEWLVIDDGSTDGTSAYLDELSARHPALVRFTTQPNGGKHRALNAGATLARGEWVMVVDSDDWLNEEALPKAFAAVNGLATEEELATIATPLQFPALRQQYRFKFTGKNYLIARWHSIKTKFDTCMIFRLSAIRAFPFPEIPGERFMAESWQHFRISHNFSCCLLNGYFVSAEYQTGGLSALSVTNRVHAPISAVLVYSEMLRAPQRWRYRLRCTINRGRFYWHALHCGKRPSKYGERAFVSELVAGLPLYLLDLFSVKKRRP